MTKAANFPPDICNRLTTYTLRITAFLDFSYRLVFQKTRRFGNWLFFRPQVKVGEKTPTQLGPLERADLNHWTLF
jgi:hypothetical protein